MKTTRMIFSISSTNRGTFSFSFCWETLHNYRYISIIEFRVSRVFLVYLCNRSPSNDPTHLHNCSISKIRQFVKWSYKAKTDWTINLEQNINLTKRRLTNISHTGKKKLSNTERQNNKIDYVSDFKIKFSMEGIKERIK